MLSRIWRIVHPLLTLLLIGCCAYLLWRDSHRPGFGSFSPPNLDRLSGQADEPLRRFVGASWLGGDYELPAEEEHCAVVLLRFENGKFRGRERATVFSPKPGGSRVVPFTVMWGPGEKGTRVLIGSPEVTGVWTRSENNPFFSDLHGGFQRSYGTASLGELRGYRVVGYAMSTEPRVGCEEFNNGVGDIDIALQNRQRVLVLGIKPFASVEEAQDWAWNQSEQSDP